MTDSASSPSMRIRPYLLTRGRTRASVELPIEAQIRTTTAGQQACPSLQKESAGIVRLCIRPLSIAEISAKLDVHLQVAKILVGDLVVEGYVSTGDLHRPPGVRPDVRLLERVLSGLQDL